MPKFLNVDPHSAGYLIVEEEDLRQLLDEHATMVLMLETLALPGAILTSTKVREIQLLLAQLDETVPRSTR